MNNALQQFALMQAQNNPNISNSPLGQEIMNVIRSGDSKAGETLANNILQSYGLTREQGMECAAKAIQQRANSIPPLIRQMIGV